MFSRFHSDLKGYLSVCREVFLDFDPFAVSKLNDKKIAVQGSPASSLLSEIKLRSIIENAHQMCKVETWAFSLYLYCKTLIPIFFSVVFLSHFFCK